MQISRKEQLMNDIIQQGELGFTKVEMVEHLKAAGVTTEEIKELRPIIDNYASASQTKSSGIAIIFSFIVSVIMLVRGIYLVNKGALVWGCILTLLGFATIVLRIADFAKRR